MPLSLFIIWLVPIYYMVLSGCTFEVNKYCAGGFWVCRRYISHPCRYIVYRVQNYFKLRNMYRHYRVTSGACPHVDCTLLAAPRHARVGLARRAPHTNNLLEHCRQQWRPWAVTGPNDQKREWRQWKCTLAPTKFLPSQLVLSSFLGARSARNRARLVQVNGPDTTLYIINVLIMYINFKLGAKLCIMYWYTLT